MQQSLADYNTRRNRVITTNKRKREKEHQLRVWPNDYPRSFPSVAHLEAWLHSRERPPKQKKPAMSHLSHTAEFWAEFTHWVLTRWGLPTEITYAIMTYLPSLMGPSVTNFKTGRGSISTDEPSTGIGNLLTIHLSHQFDEHVERDLEMWNHKTSKTIRLYFNGGHNYTFYDPK